MELGKKIKELRLKAGLTQEMLAEKMNVGPQSVSKWETSVSMPDISSLPLLSEIFGVTIDELFDLSTEQRLNRIESRMDVEEELPGDVFREYEDFLEAQLGNAEYKDRATSLIAYLYWHRMNSYAQKVRRYAKESIMAAPEKKDCQWMLNMAEGHYVWDWNFSNHSKAIDFYKEVIANDKKEPKTPMPYYYLIDNLIADHRIKEARQYLAVCETLPKFRPFLKDVYEAHFALAEFDEKTADRIIEEGMKKYADDGDYLFEAAQYHALKCEYDKAVECYEISFESDKQHKPRYTDALYGIAEIYEIAGEYRKAVLTFDRIIDLLVNEWGMTDDTELTTAKKEKARLLEKVK